MKCSFIPQFLVLVALGVGAGFVHSKIAPVKTDVDKPMSPDAAISGAKRRTTPPGAMPAPPAQTGDTGQPAAPAANPAAGKTAGAPANPAEAPPAEAPPPAASSPATGPGAAEKPADAAPAEETLSKELIDKGHITVKQAYALFASNTAYFIDTRKRAEYEAGHVKDAFGIPLAAFHGKTPKLIDAIDRTSPVVCYCLGGNCDESEEVAKNFNLMGYKNVYIMHAGFPGWKAAGHPIQTGPGIQEEE